MYFAILDGTQKGNGALSEGALASLISILMVFVILLIIIGITSLIFKLTGMFDMAAMVKKQKENENKNNNENNNKDKSYDKSLLDDDDAKVAVLVATIDYQNEIKKDVKLVNVREIK